MKWDLVLRIVFVLALLGTSLYVDSARSTLNNEGCMAYWNDFMAGVDLENKTLVNKTEARLMKKGYTPGNISESSSFNYSKYQ